MSERGSVSDASPLGADLTVSVVVPVCNSEQTLPELAQRIAAALRDRVRAFEVILVNDASRDRSWEAICRLAAGCPWVSGVNLMRNYGQHAALLCGIRAAKYAVIVTIDDDLQHPPEVLPQLLERLAAGADVVYGSPDLPQHPLWRNVASAVTRIALQSAMGVEAARNVSALRAFRTELRNAFADYRSPFVSIDVLLTWGTTRFDAVSVRHEARRYGTSNYSFGRLVLHAINTMTGYSTLPLQLASLTGFAFTLFGVGVLIYVVGRYFLQGGAVPGFPFLASVIAIFSGAQLFALGIIGEYLARMHFRMMERPPYTVRDTITP